MTVRPCDFDRGDRGEACEVGVVGVWVWAAENLKQVEQARREFYKRAKAQAGIDAGQLPKNASG
jgi:hypothetical protein